jgi:hypothetical protein
MEKLNCPEELKYITADEVAECFDVQQATYEYLWKEIVLLTEKDMVKEDHTPRYLNPYAVEPDYDRNYSIKRYWSKIDDFYKDDIIDATNKKFNN